MSQGEYVSYSLWSCASAKKEIKYVAKLTKLKTIDGIETSTKVSSEK